MELSIYDAIPHRPPFLFVDEILKISDDKIHTRLALNPEMEFFQGHYPGNPIFPGVLSCEALMQSGAILASRILQKQGVPGFQGHVPVVTRMNRVRFRKMLKPGDTVEMHVSLVTFMSDVFFMKGTMKHEGQKIVDMEFATKLARIEDLDLTRGGA